MSSTQSKIIEVDADMFQLVAKIVNSGLKTADEMYALAVFVEYYELLDDVSDKHTPEDVAYVRSFRGLAEEATSIMRRFIFKHYREFDGASLDWVCDLSERSFIVDKLRKDVLNFMDRITVENGAQAIAS